MKKDSTSPIFIALKKKGNINAPHWLASLRHMQEDMLLHMHWKPDHKSSFKYEASKRTQAEMHLVLFLGGASLERNQSRPLWTEERKTLI